MDAATRKHCTQRKHALLRERGLYEADWRDVAEHVDPYAGRYLFRAKQGAQKLPSRAKIINSVATRSLRVMDAGFMGGHTSKSRPWFRLGVSDTELLDQPGVREWLDDVTQICRDILARSNFYTELPDFYHERHLFGVGTLFVEEDSKSIVRFYQRSIGTYAIGLDHRGRCDTVWYNFKFTASQIKGYFGPVIGEQRLPRPVREAITAGRLDQEFWIDSLIEPNPDHKAGSISPMHRKFRQLYWLDEGSEEGDGCLDFQGRDIAPMLASRWSANGFDVYGPCPAIDALGDIKQLQYLEGKKLWLIDMTATPPTAMPEHMRNRGGGIRPGERMFVTPQQTVQKIEPIYTPDPMALREVREEIATVSERVGETFYADLFRMLDMLDDKQRTAYEISERKEEKIAMLGPSLESLTDEVLDPVIDIVYYFADKRGLIPEAPPALKNVEIKVEYTSMLAQAMKASAVGPIERVLGTVGQIAAAKTDPTVWDKIDVDAAIEAVHDAIGAPARMLRNDEEVAEVRDGRAQQQQQAQMAQMAPALKAGAEAMKTLGSAKVEQGSVLENMQAAGAAGTSSLVPV